MNEETEILISKAAAGELTTADRRNWEALKAAQPELQKDVDAMRRISEKVRARVDQAEARARAEVPKELPPYLLGQLETARNSVFGNAAPRRETKGMWSRLNAWFEETTRLPMPAFAAAAVILIAGGWILFQNSGGTGPTIATLPPIFKEVVVNRDLLVVAPGAETHLTDPDVSWMTFSQEPVRVEILDADGTVLADAEASRPPLSWESLTASGGLSALKPGTSYLFRLRQAEIVSEQIVRIRPDAESLHEAALLPDALETASRWLGSGHAGDALTLATRLAAQLRENGEVPSAEISLLREAAFSAALAKGTPPKEN